MANYPHLIQKALVKINNLLSSAFFRRGRSFGYKAMRSDRMENHYAVLTVMLQGCCLQFDGTLCRVSGSSARPLTVPEIASFSEINQRTVERCIADLKDLKLIQSEKQFKRLFPEGLTVSAVLRVFTRLFWEKLGLWSLFVESVKYAQQHAKLKLKRPMKLLGTVVKPDGRRRSQQNNLLFLAMTGCQHRKRGKPCSGGHQSAEICDLCRKFSV